MDARLLGTLSITVDATEVSLTSGRQRDVLATLLCNTDKYVSSTALIAVLWGDDPPPNARSAVRTYVMRLRKALGAAGNRIVTAAQGYQLVAEPDEIDILRFDRRYQAARAAVREHRWQDAVDELQPALAEWRGEPLADVDSRLLREQEKSRLTRLCVQALESYYEARLALGGHRDILPDLQRTVDAYPMQERFWAMLMLALYRSGHRGEGLAAYQRARLRLIEDLGIEPGQELRGIHEMILDDSDTVTAQVAAAESRDGERYPPIVPRQLPPAPHHFIGRVDELDALDRALPDPDGGAEQAPIVSIVGIGGIGKTSLAAHWAHRVAEHFPDGQMFINLRGFEPVGQPVPTSTALRWLLDGLHVDGARIPHSVEEQRALYRSVTSDKRLLVVLDNARDENQVRDLLPIGRGCMSVVTSRNCLVGLLVRHGCHTMRLGPLTLGDTFTLFEKYLGARRLAADPAATIEMAELSGHTPLTASVIAAEAVLQPNLTIRELLSSFGPDPTHLDLFETGDPTTSVRSLLAGTYRGLTPEARRMLRMLGLHWGERISAGAAGGLGATSAGQTRRVLAELVHHHLVEQHPNGQFALHPLAREFAAERAHQEEDPTCLHIARARLLGYYQESVTRAARRLHPRRRFPPLSPLPSVPSAERFTSADDALDWCRAHLDALLSTLAHAHRAGFPTFTWRMTEAMSTILERLGRSQDWAHAAGHALDATRDGTDPLGHAVAHLHRAAALERLAWQGGGDGVGGGDGDTAVEHLTTALELFRRLDHTEGQVHAHLWPLLCFGRRGLLAKRQPHVARALALYRIEHDRGGQGSTSPHPVASPPRPATATARPPRACHRLSCAGAVGNRLSGTVSRTPTTAPST